MSIQSACERFHITRSVYYDLDKRFVTYGFPGLLFFSDTSNQYQDLEQLTLLIKSGRPHLSYTAIHRFAQAIPFTQYVSTPKLVSKILQSHGYGISNMKDDFQFWARIQRTLELWSQLVKTPIEGRNPKERRSTFSVDQDPFHKRLELIRELFYTPQATIKKVCLQYGISWPTCYRLLDEYKLYGLWSIIPAPSSGKQTLSAELKILILLEKLKHPQWTPETIIQKHGLKVSRFAVHRVIKRWGLDDKSRTPIALDEYLGEVNPTTPSIDEAFKPLKSAYNQLPSETILSTRRINRHFEIICHKMKSHHFHICDPGPLVLAPFVSDLGVVQAF